MNPMYAITGAGLLLVTASVSAQPAAEPKSGLSVTLLCRATVQGQPFSKVLVIDFKKRLVDATPAAVSENLITWETVEVDTYANKAIVYKNELNRLSGTYRSWPTNIIVTGVGPVYVCEKAPAPKF